MGICFVEGCEKKTRSKHTGYCEMHYYRIRRNGHLDIIRKRDDRIDSAGYWVEAGPNGWTRKHRRILLEKIGPGSHPCHHCQILVSWDRTYPKDKDGLVVDHLDSDKSNNDPSNLVPSCAACNLARGNSAVRNTLREKFGLTWNGETLLSSEWADRLGISPTQIRRRIRDGWMPEAIFTTTHCGTGPKPHHILHEHGGRE